MLLVWARGGGTCISVDGAGCAAHPSPPPHPDPPPPTTTTHAQVADPGSVLFNFQRQGLVMVAASEGEDRVFEAAMDAGASDVLQDLDEDGTLLGFKVCVRLRVDDRCWPQD